MTRLRLVFTNRRTGAVAEHTGELPLSVGRDATRSDVAIDDRSVSRRHARFELDGDDLVVTDLDSSNGTFVNGGWIRRHVLRTGDRLGIGASTVEWTLVVEPEPLSDETRIGAGMTMIAPFLPPAPGRRVSPARRVVEAAEAYNREQGHELDGFLSLEYGFLPVEPPLRALPESHRAWDDLVDRLPALYASLELRAEFDRLPVLDADALPDKYLLRASVLLGVFAHAYQYVRTEPPPALPPSILLPWRQVSRRLGKDVPSVSYIDLFFYNWKLREDTGPRRLANLELLVPAWRNRAEEVFYLVTTEFAMELTPVLDAMLRAQDAVLAEDATALEPALLTMLERLHHVTRTIYPQIDPNPRSESHLDLVLWAKTVGTSGVPIFDGAPSPAGTAQPQIHALDAFFGRASYSSTVGQQSLALRAQMPRHWRELVEALGAVSVRDFVERPGNTALRGLYAAVLDAYLGDRGWMGLHRIKAYGFLEVAFKVGRSVTTGAKFTGLFRDKTWEAIDRELAEVRDERWPAGNQQVYFGRVRRGTTTTDPGSAAWTTHLRLDVAGQGIRYQPGDRLGVLPENDDALVRATLRALRATGDELVQLPAEWREAVRFRAGYEDGTEVLPLATLLTFGRIRPVGRTNAKRLLALSGAGALARIVAARMEDQWELWDVLDLVRTAGYDVTRLWSAGAGEAENIGRIVPPEVFRLYSIASAADGPAESIDLVVGGLTYTSPHTTVSYERRRTGSASHFLRRMSSDVRYREKRLSLTIVPTPRFRLPADPATPVVMFAAGSGVAPFHGFARARAAGPGPNWLFLGLRRPDDFVHPEDFARLAADGRLELRAAFSQADNALRYDVGTGAFVVGDGTRQRVDRLMTAEADALRAAVDGDAHLYVCGSAGFAGSVLDTLRELGVDVRQLIARGRLGLDIFTTYRGHAQQGARYDISALIEHNTAEAGFWMGVGGKVYDVSEFIHLHVGGPQIIQHYVGMDATSAYRGVLHDQNSEVDAQLSLYELGHLRRLDFGGRWGVVLGADGLRFAGLEELFTTWVRYVYLVVAMENALVNDYGFAGTAATAGPPPSELTPFKLQFLLEAHRRFRVSYLAGLVGEDLTALWRMTVGFCAPDRDVRALRGVEPVPDAGASVRDLLTSGADRARVVEVVQGYAAADQAVLHAVKGALRDGIRAFEECEATVVERAGGRLLAAIEAVLDAVEDYHRRLDTMVGAHGFTPAADPPIPPDRGVPGHGTPRAH
ncbi:FHA domain-containing protein [Cryptosporangium arvum]|uniref:FHA domain-containing protein n=1 Tax=Cryptosporangium arvum TaxID=80871 RepID=UPI0004B0B23B|nr:FHA domain-containing protein [Cryptosporangium arvum]